jgi:hypothetical protein
MDDQAPVILHVAGGAEEDEDREQEDEHEVILFHAQESHPHT